jgi:IS5 family transposase
MRPKQPPKARHDDLFRARLDQIINMKHELVILADKIDWAWLDNELAGRFSDQGRPAEPVRFMIGMFMLKHTYSLSDGEGGPWPKAA